MLNDKLNTTHVLEIIYSANRLGVWMWIQDNALKYKAPVDIDVSEVIHQLKQNKEKIIEILRFNNVIDGTPVKDFIYRIEGNRHSLSFAQERLWFIEQFEGGTNAFHVPEIFMLDEDTNKDGIKYALQQIVKRHEVLRSTIENGEDGEQGIQLVHTEPLSFMEVSTAIGDDFESQIREDVNRPFDLAKEYPIRVTFYDIASTVTSLSKRLMVVNIHHIASDGWSDEIFQNELLVFYEAYLKGNYKFELPALEIQYKDFAYWQKSYLNAELATKQLDYWKDRLEGYKALDFPTDYLRPVKTDYRGATLEFTLTKENSNRLRELARQLGVSLHSVLLSCFSILLGKYAGQKDIITGTPIAGRNNSQTESLIGFFVNSQVNRVLLNETDSFKDLVQQVHEDQMEAQLHQDLPFEKLVEHLVLDRETSKHPVFQFLFSVQGFGNLAKTSNTNSLYLKPFAIEKLYDIEKLDLSVHIDDSAEELIGSISYAISLFKDDTIQRFYEHFVYLLQELLKYPEKPYNEVSLLSAAQYDIIVNDWSGSDAFYAHEKTVVDLFADQVLRVPSNVAIECNGESYTYSEIDQSSNLLASHLRAHYNVSSGELVGIMLDRSESLIISILAVLKVGAAYVCIDPSYPSSRKEFICKDASINVLITQADYIFELDFYNGNVFAIDVELSGLVNSNLSLNRKIETNDLAYVIYTSGTTGNPKGVMITHGAIVSLVKNNYIDFGPDDVFVFLSSASFDASTFEIYTPLLSGNQLVVPLNQKELISGPDAFRNFIASKGVSIVWLTKTLFENLYHLDNSLYVGLNYLIVGGEALDKHMVNKLLNSAFKPKHFINGYGPTESTTFTCSYPMQVKIESQHVPIGKPIQNRRVYVLDEKNVPVAIGIKGELYIGGAGLSVGYLNHEKLTMERFIDNPFAGASDKELANNRLYKTGDVVRWLSDGNLEYIGRNDDQVKLRGYRIELGEIENALLRINGIRQACVVLQERINETAVNKYLVGYYVTEDEFRGLKKEYILEQLASELPDYMVPTALVSMEAFPLTVNGKLDKGSLPVPDFNEHVATYRAPETEDEKKICAIWQEVLGIERVGTTDDFFRLGGNSILAIQVSHKMSKALEWDIKVADLFKHKTVNNLKNNFAQNLLTENTEGESWEITI